MKVLYIVFRELSKCISCCRFWLLSFFVNFSGLLSSAWETGKTVLWLHKVVIKFGTASNFDLCIIEYLYAKNCGLFTKWTICQSYRLFLLCVQWFHIGDVSWDYTESLQSIFYPFFLFQGNALFFSFATRDVSLLFLNSLIFHNQLDLWMKLWIVLPISINTCVKNGFKSFYFEFRAVFYSICSNLKFMTPIENKKEYQNLRPKSQISWI